MKRLIPGLQRAAGYLAPHRDALLESWVRSLVQNRSATEGDARALCTKALDPLLDRFSRGEVEALLEEEARVALEHARAGASFNDLALAIRAFDRCCLPFLLETCPDRETLGECLLALDELGVR